jgi:opacity protein-like surface antigen
MTASRSVLRWLCLALALAGGLASVASTAQAPAANVPVYNIEFVLFRAGNGPAEDWSTPGARAPLPSGDSASGGVAQIGRLVGSLSPAQHQLTNEVAKLRANGNYQILTHIAWQQTASSWGTRAGFSLARLGSQAAGLTGMVYLERGTYLHLGVNLQYNSYRIDETRRVKFYEKQYYDHPMIGVLALITPVQGGRAPGR